MISGRDIASAMTYLENQGIVHGMIRAQSVFLRRNESGFVAKLTNFGVASKLKEKEVVSDFPVRWSVRIFVVAYLLTDHDCI